MTMRERRGGLARLRDRRRQGRRWGRPQWTPSDQATLDPLPLPADDNLTAAEEAVRAYVLGLARAYEGDAKIISKQPKVRNYAKLMGVDMDKLKF